MSSTTEQKPERKSPEQERNSNETTSPFVRSPPKVAKSLKWHDAPISSTREIISPGRDDLPEGPSFDETKEEVVAVFNANTAEGGSMVRALNGRGSKVIAIVRVFTSRNTKALLKLKNVVVKVADSHDEAALSKAVKGAHRAFLVTTYWERFENSLEERQASIVLEACSKNNVRHLVLSSFEDTKILREKGLKSQIVPKRDGTIQPKFEGIQRLKEFARERNVQLTHMITSYVDQEASKKSLCLIVGENGNVIIQPHLSDDERAEF